MIQGWVVVVWLALCAIQDLRERQIANGLTLGVGLLALIYLLWIGVSWLGFPASDAAWAFGLVLLLTLPGYALGHFGAGDVKLLAALALASGVECLLVTLVGAGLALGGWWLIVQGLSRSAWVPATGASIKQPFAPFVLTGFALYWLWIH